MGAAIARLEQQAEEAARHAERLEKMLALARELGDEGVSEMVALLAPTEGNGKNGNGHAAKAKTNKTRGRDAIRVIVAKRPGIWTFAQLKTEMVREGWFVSDTGLEAAAKRLCDLNGEGRRIGKGRYVFPADHGEEVTDEEAANDAGGVALTAMAQ
jgi:hypothetical protein